MGPEIYPRVGRCTFGLERRPLVAGPSTFDLFSSKSWLSESRRIKLFEICGRYSVSKGNNNIWRQRTRRAVGAAKDRRRVWSILMRWLCTPIRQWNVLRNAENGIRFEGLQGRTAKLLEVRREKGKVPNVDRSRIWNKDPRNQPDLHKYEINLETEFDKKIIASRLLLFSLLLASRKWSIFEVHLLRSCFLGYISMCRLWPNDSVGTISNSLFSCKVKR